MAYTPTNWKDRVVEKPRTYRMQDNGDGTITLIPEPGTIYEPGTPVNAANLNKIENGLQAAAATADGAASAISTHASRTDNPHAVTKAQVGLGNVQNYGIATQAQAEDGSANNVYMTPLRTKNYVDTRLLNNLKFRLNSGSLEYEDGGTWKPVGGVKKVQRGEAGVGGSFGTVVDVTITAVDLSKTFIILSSYGAPNANNLAVIGASLVDPTTLRLTSSGSNQYTTVYWQVVESY